MVFQLPFFIKLSLKFSSKIICNFTQEIPIMKGSNWQWNILDIENQLISNINLDIWNCYHYYFQNHLI